MIGGPAKLIEMGELQAITMGRTFSQYIMYLIGRHLKVDLPRFK